MNRKLSKHRPKLKQDVLVKKSFAEHYAELRLRVMIIAITLLITTLGSYYIADDIYAFLVQPLAQAMGEDSHNRHLIFTGLAEGLMAHLKLSFISGLFFSAPVIIWQLYAFIAPGLYRREKYTVLAYVASSPILFILGAVFVYYVVIPAAWAFFLSFEYKPHAHSLPIVLEARVSEYLDLIVEMIIAFGLSFQMPIVLALLTKIGLLKTQNLIKGRRYAIVLIFILAAVLTPPDVFSQITLALPLLVLYELSIWICKIIEKNNARY